MSAQLERELKTGEAGFAASGTTIVTKQPGMAWIATGGSVANIYYTHNRGFTWYSKALPILQGENSTGPFSMAFYDQKNGVIVGGNYLKDKDNSNNVLFTRDGGQNWIKPVTPVSGYRSGVAYISKSLVIATGTSGTDISEDGGMKWHNISGLSFNAVQKSKKGNLVLLAGSKGEIFQLIVKNKKPSMILKIHHIAVICSDYKISKAFYTEVLGLTPIREVYREERSSFKLDLALNGEYIIELFSFPEPPMRPSRPEAAGLRHLAFEVDDLDEVILNLQAKGVPSESVRTDEFTGKRFTFIADPDQLPIEFYEI